MEFHTKNLILLPLFYIVNATPLYPRLLTYNNYNGFDNAMQYADNADTSSHYRNIMNVRRIENGKLMNIDDTNANVYGNQDEFFYASIPTQDVGLDFDEYESPFHDTSELLQTSENSFYDHYMPLASIYPVYPIASFQQPLIQHDLQQLSSRIERSPVMSALFSLQTVPLLRPLILITQPPNPDYHQTENIPPQNMRRFSFQMPEMPSFPDFSKQFSSHFANFDDLFNSKFNSKNFLPALVHNAMLEENGKAPAVIQIGKNNKNVKSGIQQGIIQINRKNTDNKYNDLRRTVTEMAETTTEFPSTETSTLEMDTTTFALDDRVDINVIKSLAGK